MLKKIKALVNEKEVKELDRVIEEIYSIEDGSNNSIAFQLGFDTVSNHNGSGYKNLVIIIDSLNDGGEDEAFARYLLEKVFDEKKLERLKEELKKNRNRYISILYL